MTYTSTTAGPAGVLAAGINAGPRNGKAVAVLARDGAVGGHSSRDGHGGGSEQDGTADGGCELHGETS